MQPLPLIALLPMKGHSERVPNKNLRSFAGRPLYHAVMEALLGSPLVKEVVINTDSDTIARDALSHFDRVRIVKRPPEIQGDFVSMNEIIRYDLSQLEGDYFLQTHSTNPLLTSATITAAIERFFSVLPQYDSLFSVTRLQTRLYWEDGRPVNHNPDELLRTQDLPPVFEENSNFYIFSREAFSGNQHKRIGKRPVMYEIPKLEAVDIDYPEDFELAETLYKQTHS